MNREKGVLASVASLVRQPLVANAGYLLGVNLVASLVGFVFWGLAARIYRPENVGVASAVLSAVALVAGIADLGVGASLVRFLPESRSPSRLLNTAFTFNGVMAVLIGGVFLAGLSLWSPALIDLQRNVLYVVGFLACTTASTLGAVVRMAFVARRQAVYALAHVCVVNVGRLLLVVILAGRGAAGLVGSVVVAVVVAVTLSVWGFLPQVEPGYRPRPGFSWSSLSGDMSGIVSYSGGNYVAVLLAQTSQMVLPLIVLEMLGSASSGYTYIAWMLGSLLTSPGIAVASSAFAEGSNSPRQLTVILVKASALGLLLTLPAALILGLVAPWILSLFGPSYAQEASRLLRWLAAAAPMVVLAGLYFTRLRVQKRVRRLVLLSGIVAAATLGMAAILMPRVGIAANGIGWLVGNSLVAAVAAIDVWREILPDRSEMRTQNTPGDPESPETRNTVVAAIPCYNEARFVADVVRRTLNHVDAVAVVDDGSTDDTVEVAQAAGAQVVQHPTNMGPGVAARDCLQAGRDMQADVLVTLDGDGQHNPDELPEVIAPILAGEADLVIGSRFMGRYNNVARYRRFGIDVITFLFNFGAPNKITDGQSCFRAYNRRALQVLRITEPGFGFS
ncbi:MAG: glycosyltransferase, partial [Anaerolineae bacterium]